MKPKPFAYPAPDPMGGIHLSQERWRVVVSRILMVGLVGWIIATLEACVLIGR